MSGAALGRRRALLLVALGALAMALPALWRVLFVPREGLDPALVARVQAEGAPPAIGGRGATVVLFTDARCPVCRGTEAALAEAMGRDPSLRLVVRDWPILGPDSLAAARAALAARDEPGYPAFRRALSESRGALDPAGIARLAAGAGIDPVRLATLQVAHATAIDGLLAENARLAGRLGLPGTPGLLIGDQLVRGGLDAWQLHRVLAAEAG